jgi:hypothetical protein
MIPIKNIINPRKCIINIQRHKKIENDNLINGKNKDMISSNEGSNKNINFFLDNSINFSEKIIVLIKTLCECFPGAIKCKFYEYNNILFHLVIVNDGIYHLIYFCHKINFSKITNILCTNYKYICFSLDIDLSNTIDIINEISLFIIGKKKFSFIGFKETTIIYKNMDHPKIFILLKTYTNGDGEIIDLLFQEEESKKIYNYDKYTPIIYRDKNYDINFLIDLVGNMRETDVVYFHSLELINLDKHKLSYIFYTMLHRKLGFISSIDYTSSNFLENTHNLVKMINDELIILFNLNPNNDQPLKLKPSFGEKIVNGKHVPDPKEKEIIELIRKYIEEDNFSINKIVILLNKDNIRTKSNKSWYASTVKNVIEKNNIKIKKNV